MKRFITYLYECERGNKSRNIGFIRVNIRNKESTMEFCINNFSHSSDTGKIYALIYKKDLLGIDLGKIEISDGQSEARFSFQTEDMMGSGYSINDVLGIGIRLESGEYIASCWREEYGEAIARGEFQIQKEISDREDGFIEKLQTESVAEQKTDLELPLAAAEEKLPSETITYKKIDIDQLRDLPSPNWYLATNSFLVHGVWNYGYLVLKKEMEEDKEKLSLGIPGVFEKPEAVMAILFGFPAFEEIPSEMVNAKMNHDMSFPQKEKNQETEVGTFGCWFVTLQE